MKKQLEDVPARRSQSGLRAEPKSGHRILVPIDFTRASVHGLRCAARLAERLGTTVYLVHVIEEHPFAMNEVAALLMKENDEIARDSIGQLSRLGREELGSHVHAGSLVCRGKKAADGILQAAETLDSDLIIMASHKRTALGRVLFGSTAGRVLRRASCPVLVIPCVDQSQLELTLWRDSEETDDKKPFLLAA
jgi:nucleotide-binding universal stress UspA family protein